MGGGRRSQILKEASWAQPRGRPPQGERPLCTALGSRVTAERSHTWARRTTAEGGCTPRAETEDRGPQVRPARRAGKRKLHPEQWNSPNVKPGDHHRNDAHLTLSGGSACLHSFMLRPKDSSISSDFVLYTVLVSACPYKL